VSSAFGHRKIIGGAFLFTEIGAIVITDYKTIC